MSKIAERAETEEHAVALAILAGETLSYGIGLLYDYTKAGMRTVPYPVRGRRPGTVRFREVKRRRWRVTGVAGLIVLVGSRSRAITRRGYRVLAEYVTKTRGRVAPKVAHPLAMRSTDLNCLCRHHIGELVDDFDVKRARLRFRGRMRAGEIMICHGHYVTGIQVHYAVPGFSTSIRSARRRERIIARLLAGVAGS